MKFIVGTTYAYLIGSLEEQAYVRALLTIEDNPSLLRSDNSMYAGLVDFVLENTPATYTVEVSYGYSYSPTSITDIDIPNGYIANGDPTYEDRDYQIKSVKKAIVKGRGVLELATGSGKTEIACMISKYLLDNNKSSRIYIVAGTRFLASQAYERFKLRGFKDISILAGGCKFRAAKVQICVIDSLMLALKNHNTSVCSDFAYCDCIFYDEVHHISADKWIRVGELCTAKYRYGLTATLWSDPFKYSYKDFFLIGLTGGLIASVPSSHLIKLGYLAEPIVTMFTVANPKVRFRKWDRMYKQGIVMHDTRNSIISSLAYSLYTSSYKTLIFVGYVDHGLALAKVLRDLGCKNVRFVRGGDSMYEWLPSGRWKRTKTSIEEIANFVKSNDRSIIVGNCVLDEGIDIPSFNALIMGTAMKKYRRTVQRVGRGMRPKADDNHVYIFDFYDATCPTLYRHSTYRAQTYELEGYVFSDALDDTCARMGANLQVSTEGFEWKRVQKFTRIRKLIKPSHADLDYTTC